MNTDFTDFGIPIAPVFAGLASCNRPDEIKKTRQLLLYYREKNAEKLGLVKVNAHMIDKDVKIFEVIF